MRIDLRLDDIGFSSTHQCNKSLRCLENKYQETTPKEGLSEHESYSSSKSIALSRDFFSSCKLPVRKWYPSDNILCGKQSQNDHACLPRNSISRLQSWNERSNFWPVESSSLDSISAACEESLRLANVDKNSFHVPMAISIPHRPFKWHVSRSFFVEWWQQRHWCIHLLMATPQSDKHWITKEYVQNFPCEADLGSTMSINISHSEEVSSLLPRSYSMSRSRNSKAALRARTHSKVWYLMQRGSEVVIYIHVKTQNQKTCIMLLSKLCQSRHTYCQRWLSSWGHVDSNIATNERRSAPSWHYQENNPQTNDTIQIHSNTTTKYQPFRY